MWNYGGEWTGYVEWIEFLRVVAGYERDGRVEYDKWQSYADLTMHAGIRVMHKEFCIISDRPSEIHIETVNGRGRLHNLSGPAKRYRDGWSIYEIHGVRVPAQVIEAPQTLTVEQIRGEQNAEVRRVMIERYGAAKYIEKIGATVIARDEYGELLSADVGDTEPYVFVRVLNSTPEPIEYKPAAGEYGEWVGKRWAKYYTLRVSPHCKTAKEAVAWTYEMTAEEYAPCRQT
jgi:hypothetical protein